MTDNAPGQPAELRYADGPTTEAGLYIDAPPEAVWALVSDIQTPARFSSEFDGAEFIDGAAGPAVGARFVGRNHHAAAGAWETVCEIVECEPGVRFGWVVGPTDFPSSHWRFELSPEGTGTRVTQWMRMGPAPSGINIAIEAMPDKESRILRRRLGEHLANMEANLQGIKALLESA
jgi:uncharacterized protein YndB with AHSA1/START domain